MTPVAVFDTNILLSGTAWRGMPFKCLELVRADIVDGITCEEILQELFDVLQRKLKFSEQQSCDVLADLLGSFRVVEITGDLKAVEADPDDDKVLETAVVSGAQFVVTGDRRHLLPLKQFQDISIVTAAEFVAEMEENP